VQGSRWRLRGATPLVVTLVAVGAAMAIGIFVGAGMTHARQRGASVSSIATHQHSVLCGTQVPRPQFVEARKRREVGSRICRATSTQMV
jgi:hypothetical protein